MSETDDAVVDLSSPGVERKKKRRYVILDLMKLVLDLFNTIYIIWLIMKYMPFSDTITLRAVLKPLSRQPKI